MLHSFENIPIIGMSPGNSYFKDDEIRHLLWETLKRFWYAVVFIADIPAIQTYRALGYDEKKARQKAVLKGNNLKNKVQKACKDLGIHNHIVRIIDWAQEVENNPEYLKRFENIQSLFFYNADFHEAVIETTKAVLQNSGRDISDMDKAAEQGCFYLLSELAFLDFASSFLGVDRVTYVYHRLWPVYEDYLAGKFDVSHKPHLGFQLLEAPHEYFESVLFRNALDRTQETWQLLAGFIDYRYALYRKDGEYTGFFYELIQEICRHNGWKLVLTGKTSYGAAIQGLNNGKFDIYISPTWITEERLRQALFSSPVHRSQAYVWTRQDMDIDFFQLHPSLRMAVLETDITDTLGSKHFPSAIKRSFSGISRIEDLLHSVDRGETDFTICEEMTYQSYRDEGWRALKKLFPEPIAVFDNCFMFQKQETELCKKVDETIDLLRSTGFIASLLERYSPYIHQ